MKSLKKVVLLCTSLLFIAGAFTSCNKDADPEVFTDGKITLVNNFGKELVVQLFVVDTSISGGNAQYAQKKDLSAQRRIKNGESLNFDFNWANSYVDDNHHSVAVYTSQTSGTGTWYRYNCYSLYQMHTTITITPDTTYTYMQTAKYTAFEEYTPLHSDSETPNGYITVKNATDENIWFGLMGWKAHGVDAPALYPRTLVKAGDTLKIPYFSSDLGSGKIAEWAKLIYKSDISDAVWCWDCADNTGITYNNFVFNSRSINSSGYEEWVATRSMIPN